MQIDNVPMDNFITQVPNFIVGVTFYMCFPQRLSDLTLVSGNNIFIGRVGIIFARDIFVIHCYT